MYRMEVKRVGLKNQDDISRVRGEYAALDKQEKQEFFQFLENFDKKGETGRYGRFVRKVVAPAVLLGRCNYRKVLQIARDEYYYFIRAKQEAAKTIAA